MKKFLYISLIFVAMILLDSCAKEKVAVVEFQDPFAVEDVENNRGGDGVIDLDEDDDDQDDDEGGVIDLDEDDDDQDDDEGGVIDLDEDDDDQDDDEGRLIDERDVSNELEGH